MPLQVEETLPESIVGAVLVVGGGVSGMQASLDLANAGYKVFLVEKDSAIGGHMAQLDKTFPTNDCAMCTISPRLVEVGRHLNIEILTQSELESLSGTAGNFKARVRRRPRFVDPSQYINRLRAFDYDIIIGGWGESESPGNEQRMFWSTAAADSPASRNFIGIKDPVIDELIELLIVSPTRESLVARTRALDRVLLWNHFVIPNWHLRQQRLLYWDKFDRPAEPAKFGTSWALWWFDPVKAARLDERRAAEPLTSEAPPAEGQGLGLGLAVLAGLLFAGALLFRRALQRPQT